MSLSFMILYLFPLLSVLFAVGDILFVWGIKGSNKALKKFAAFSFIAALLIDGAIGRNVASAFARGVLWDNLYVFIISLPLIFLLWFLLYLYRFQGIKYFFFIWILSIAGIKAILFAFLSTHNCKALTCLPYLVHTVFHIPFASLIAATFSYISFMIMSIRDRIIGSKIKISIALLISAIIGFSVPPLLSIPLERHTYLDSIISFGPYALLYSFFSVIWVFVLPLPSKISPPDFR